MKPIEFLKSFFYFQKDIAFDILKKLDFGILGFSKTNNSLYWNTVLVDRTISIKELKEIEKLMVSYKRNPCIYFLQKNNSQNIKLLEKEEYTEGGIDQWLFFKDKKIDEDRFNQVKKVENKMDLEIFLNTFNNCYQKDDPQNPYGEVGDYLESCKEAWIIDNSNKLEYFIIYDENKKPVAVSALTNYKGIGYISNVGSLQSVRGQGFGKVATLYCVYKSQLNGNKTHCLATEKDNYPYEFYKRIGFEDKFSAVYYQKIKN